MPGQTKSVLVRIKETDLDMLTDLKKLIRETYIAAGVRPPDPITHGWAIRVSLQMHLDVLEGQMFAMRVDQFRSRFSEALIQFATDALASHGIEVKDVIEDGDTVCFVSENMQGEPIGLTALEGPAVPASVAAH